MRARTALTPSSGRPTIRTRTAGPPRQRVVRDYGNTPHCRHAHTHTSVSPPPHDGARARWDLPAPAAPQRHAPGSPALLHQIDARRGGQHQRSGACPCPGRDGGVDFFRHCRVRCGYVTPNFVVVAVFFFGHAQWPWWCAGEGIAAAARPPTRSHNIFPAPQVALPQGESCAAWVAVHAIDFFNDVTTIWAVSKCG